MKIIVDGKEAFLKEDLSFEYVRENPLFTDAEGYSLEIPFPLKDCPQNILIFGPLHVKGVDIAKVTFPCEIITSAFRKTGILTIVSVSDVEVQGQFLDGMSMQGCNNQGLDLYIDEIDFSPIDGTDGDATSVMDNENFADLPVWDKDADDVFHLMPSQPVSRHIYLWYLVDWIVSESGYDVDLSIIEAYSVYRSLVVCNSSDVSTYCDDVFSDSLFSSFYFMDIEKTLPHWTVREFLDNLAAMFGVKAIIDTQNKKISMMRFTDLINTDEVVNLNVNDDFDIEIQDSENIIAKAANWKFPDECNPDNINNCMWIYDYLDKIKVVQLLDPNYYDPAWLAQNLYPDDVFYRKSRLYELQGNVRGIYAAVTDIEKRDDVTDPYYSYYGLHFVQFEVLNQFSCEDDAQELKLYPAVLEWKRLNHKVSGKWAGFGRDAYGCPEWVETDSDFALPYRMPVVNVAQYKPTEMLSDNQWVLNAGELIDKGNPEVKIEGIQLVIFNSSMEQTDGRHLNTRKWEPVIGTQYLQETISATEGLVPNYNTGLYEYAHTIPMFGSEFGGHQVTVPQVDETKLYRFKFLATLLPSATAVYVIKGHKYACRCLTAHFTINGMSELIEGEFYRIVD